MMTQKKPVRPSSFLALVRSIRARHHCGRGLVVLILSLLLLSLLAGANFEGTRFFYVAGQIADHDVVADRDMQVEDIQATQARRKQVLLLQPPVYDLSLEPLTHFQGRVLAVLKELSAPRPAVPDATAADPAAAVPPEDGALPPAQESPADGMVPPSPDPALQHLSDELTPRVAAEVLPQLARADVQAYLLKKLMPIITERLTEGLVSDIRMARVGRAGAIIHNLDNGTELLRPDVTSLPDVQSFLAELTAHMQRDHELDASARRALGIFLGSTLPPTLTLNREATQKRGNAVVENVEPVFYQIQKGELIVRKGARVSREQQIKTQALYENATEGMHWNTALGTFLFALVFSVGFFMAPSGKPGTPLRCKDMLLISLVLLLFGIGAKALFALSLVVSDLNHLAAFAVGFPVAGAVGLVAMVFAARRYCTMGLLLCLFTTLMFQQGYQVFLYHFLGGMLATWLVTSAQTRQDVIWSIVPLTLGQAIICLAMLLASHTALELYPAFAVAVLTNSVVSLILLFALSPILEITFSYSTRFRLMELMSLEHPLMQELMVTIPGTYHHSLVVANMVEAGAKAIGANSLLCKVAALYHDAGKIAYPEYFIENQFGGPNKHDKLAPSMSALILISHVKKGTELAERYNLGQEIIDIIRQHHGTRIIRYFYQKAINMGEKPRESDYCYPGPRPQTKEAAILMLADSVEASSRTLSDPTPARIRTHIDTIIKGIFSEGQLDESELTFKDLHFLSENFQRILTGLFHQRIAYPDSRIKAGQPSGRAESRGEGKAEGRAAAGDAASPSEGGTGSAHAAGGPARTAAHAGGMYGTESMPATHPQHKTC
ncbi:HDIG domain-containing metalloprotein [uncultured Desulfovibrio sp.]|uniref:HD family phosphohydrolase n=1 Tax=uncultured Desulfovibrio sp. TaxID=167968 RepID=UPI002604C366|nr:HDIG domain-containing metalloprotein [uncultured Desulfovibrio sp.]